MDIHKIKRQLSILTVLSHYGLVPDKNGMLTCPFHDDRKASMKVYPETNTVYCFAGGCSVQHLDVIDLILHLEDWQKLGKEGKHFAIEKAKTLLGAASPTAAPSAAGPKQEDPAKALTRYHKSIATNKKAQEYCTGRKLDWQALGIGYKSRKTKTRWGRGCIIFGLRNGEGEVCGLYGRSIFGGGHYYQTGRQGLYPCYPDKNTRTIVLCESIIDTASLQDLQLPLEDYALLAMYGTENLNEEHRRAIQNLEHLEEIIFALDGDDAGRESVVKNAKILQSVKGDIKYSTLTLPEGEDINSLLISHDDAQGLFTKIFDERTAVELPALPVNTEAHSQTSPTHTSKNLLNTEDPLNLIFITTTANYYIRGGLKYGLKDMDSLKVTLVVENHAGRQSRNTVNLYEDKQVEKVARYVADRLGLRADLVELDIMALISPLETYRNTLYNNNGNSTKKEVPKVPPDIHAESMRILKDTKLFTILDKMMEDFGIVGERNNRRLGSCIVFSPHMNNPLHGLIQGSSGSGKTYLLSKLCALCPPEFYIAITRATDNSFYNFKEYELKNKLISIEDKDAMSDDSNLAFRELQSNAKLSSSTSGQDANGHIGSYIRWVYGPIASLACTTKGELYLDDMNRCFLMAVDESLEQTRAVLRHQKLAAAGKLDKEKQKRIQLVIQQMIRLIKPYDVVIPFAPDIYLPPDVKDKRRLNRLYLDLVKQVTLIHQYQRQKDDKGRLISTLDDLALANEIMFDAIVLKVDELYGPLRSFYEKLKVYLKKQGGENAQKMDFRQREIRQALHLSKTSTARYMQELVEMEYVEVVSGSDRRGYVYRICYWDDNEAMRKRIKHFLSDQIVRLRKKHRDNK